MESSRIYRFDDVVVDAGAMRLVRGGQELALEPKLFRLLEFLIVNRERVLGKEEIFRVVWEETSVSDNALTRAVAQIRKVLGDDPKNPRYIETVPTVGYRFIGELAAVEAVKPVAVVAGGSKRVRNRAGLWTALGVAIAAATGFTTWQMRAKPPEAPVSAPIPLTTYRGSEESPSFSPDGNQVAFEWNGEKQEKFDIYVKVLGSDSTPLRLTSDPAPSRYPAWSPDGRTIAFQRLVNPGRSYLMLIPALGGPERKLAEFHSWTDSRGSNPAWSADSRWVIVPGMVGQRSALFRVSVETGESSQITDPPESVGDAFPAVSPDGKTLLFSRHPAFNGGGLYVVRIDGDVKPVETPRPVPAGVRSWMARWTADGSDILARVLGGADCISVSGSVAPQRISWLGTGADSFDVSRRGNRVAFSVVRGDANVWRIDLTAKELHPEPLIASTVRDVFPQYSPDGKKLAFHSSRSGTGLQVWESDSEGNQARQLTFNKSGLTGTPHWSPDGTTIAFDSSTTGHFQVYTMSSDGGKIKQLTNEDFDSFGPTWSRDGRWVYFTSRQTGRNEVWKMPVEGGSAIQVTRKNGVMAMEAPDGKTLIFSKEGGTGAIWKMPIAGGPEEQLTDSLYRTNYAVTKNGVYYMTAPGVDGTSVLKLHSFTTTGGATTILPIGLPEYGLDVSPDGRYLVYDQLDDPASDLMLLENFR